MRVLALDTTTRAGSAALVEGDRLVDQRAGDGTRTHALRMPGEILALAESNGWSLSTIELYAVASGPGSFTGLRIGIATIQALAYVHHRRVVAVPMLDALAHASSVDLAAGSLVAAWTDAHRRDVFAAVYRVESAPPFSRDRLTEIDGPIVGAPEVAIKRWAELGSGLPTIVTGDGAILYAADIAQEAPSIAVVAPPHLAGTIGRLATARAADALPPSEVRPLYVRRPDAEVLRDEKLRLQQRQPRDT